MKFKIILFLCCLPMIAFSQPIEKWRSPSYLESGTQYNLLPIKNDPTEYRCTKVVPGFSFQIMSAVYDTTPVMTIPLLPSEISSYRLIFDVSGDGYNDLFISRQYASPFRYGFRIVNSLTGVDWQVFDDSTHSYYLKQGYDDHHYDIDDDGFNELIVEKVNKATSPDQAFRELVVYKTDGKATSVSVKSGAQPSSFGLQQNFPNPFNPETQIQYTLNLPGSVDVTIHDINGRVVRSYSFPQQEVGSHRFDWNGRNNEGMPVASGAYFYTIMVDKHSESKKMLLLR